MPRFNFIALLLCAALCGCGPPSATNSETGQGGVVTYVATIAPLGAFLRPIVAGRAEVSVLLSPGASEHTYEVKPAEARAASRARALVYIDDSLDGWSAKLEAPARIRLTENFPPGYLREFPGGDGTLDPHVWMDPRSMATAILRTVAALSELDPAGAKQYRNNAESFSIELSQLDAQLEAELAPLRGRAVVQFHPSMYYFLDRYGIRTAGVLETSAGQEPSAKTIAALAERMRADGVGVIVAEPQLADAPVRALAEATGARVAHLDPLGGVAGRETYAELLRYNARALREAFR